MRRLVAAALLLAAALGVHLGVTLPARRQRNEAREAFARAREERATLRAAAVRLERLAAAGRAPAGEAAAARALRQSFLHAVEGLPLGAVRIGAEAARGTAAARGRLSAQGRQADVLRAAGRLAEPSSGALLERVSFAEARGEVRVELEAYSVRGES